MAASFKIPFLVVGALFVVWGAFGLLDLRNLPYDGFRNSLDYTVIEVEEETPAAAAGLKVGDRIITYNGVPVEDTRAFTRMPRPEIGETRILVVESADTTLVAVEAAPVTREVALTYGTQPGRYVALTCAAFIIGLCFIGFGLLAYLKAPSRPAMLLALTGLCIGIGLVGAPYIGSYALRTIVDTITLLVLLFGFATLLHCLMEFPKTKPILGKQHATKVLYAPVVLTALFSLWLAIVVPRGTGTLNTIVNAIYGIFVVLYFGLALAALIHSFVKATRAERSRFGLNLLLAGVIIGLLPTIIEALVSVIAPSVIMPGSDFFFLTAVLIPITLALAVMKLGAGPAAELTPVT